MKRRERRPPSRAANLWTARIIPLVLLGIIGYSSWVATKLVIVDYLLNPDPSTLVQPRPGAAIAILVIYYILLIALLICYGRLIHTIFTNPGFTARGAGWYIKKEQDAQGSASRKPHSRGRGHRHSRSDEKDRSEKPAATKPLPRDARVDDAYPAVQDFWHKDVFVCNYDGRPPFCSRCFNWKSDRTHHCSEVDRCTRKMDHFCPWVGGIISETSVKFFIQFTFYTGLFCTHAVVFIAYFFAERIHKTHYLNVHWTLTLAFAALFLFFSAGICTSSVQLALINSTTIDNLSRRTKIYYLAVHLPRPEQTLSRLSSTHQRIPMTITYPRPDEETAMMATFDPNNPPPSTLRISPPSPNSRTFAILELPRGANPWYLSRLENLQEVLGYSFLEWFLPLHPSPCSRHNDPESLFRLGPAVADAKKAAGLEEPGLELDGSGSPRREKKRRRRRRKRRRESSGAEDESGEQRETDSEPERDAEPGNDDTLVVDT